METLKDASMTTFAPHLQVIICEDARCVFSRGVNIGIITEDDIFLVKQDFFTGGKKNTIYTDQDIKIITESLKLKGATTEERIKAIENAAIELVNLKDQMKKEKDPTNGNALRERSRALVKEFANETNIETGMEIEDLYKKNFEKAPAAPAAPDPAAAELEAAKKNDLKKLADLTAKMIAVKKKKEANALMKQAEAIRDLYKKDPEIKAAFSAIKKQYNKK